MVVIEVVRVVIHTLHHDVRWLGTLRELQAHMHKQQQQEQQQLLDGYGYGNDACTWALLNCCVGFCCGC
jgi:hypothetical protein